MVRLFGWMDYGVFRPEEYKSFIGIIDILSKNNICYSYSFDLKNKITPIQLFIKKKDEGLADRLTDEKFPRLQTHED